MIALIDYRAGNLTSVRKALAAIGADVYTPDTAADLSKAAGIIVPGVGHFDATRTLDQEWVAVIRDLLQRGRPLLGICLGMQWLFEGSDEAPDVPGLGLLPGRCYRLGGRVATAAANTHASPNEISPDPGDGSRYRGRVSVPVRRPVPGTAAVKIPHVGWNTLSLQRTDSIVSGVPDESQVYFTHSYVAPITPETVAATEHGEPFASVVQRDLVAGVQFHPEKSGDVGLQILKNWTGFVRHAV